ncbi:Succinoglycan biosynthesis transport protein ExoT [Alteripontixanthobacter maritimus]|uniref:Succinoglycan biosynthesis transport protein ExoT n=1 Tax=Alteripontixanthobacter maritimus TaxID=2161824 RepID=A0A369Q2W3_9SPHN|nr:lipopolysaccharide biosynthesis protein [Alteripontixanthobacter maritimus]RDC59104.1 Succinoglycan biosynthesis transport protein ExoT [Alteripontixanthobacter maritimus]
MSNVASPPVTAAFGTRVRSAMAWRWGSQVGAQAITWASTLAVVRLLEPSDYGLFAMTQVVLAALAFLNGYGFATSLIQTDDLSDRRVRQVFGMLLLANGSLAIAQFFLAPVAAAYYGQPLVADMLRIQAVLFLTTPFIAMPSALLARRIEFRWQGLVNLICAVIGGTTALVLAWFGFGVWALVYAPIAMFTARGIGLSIAARLWVKPVFDFRGAGDIVTFGGALTICQLFWILQSQSDIFIAGRAFSPHELGLYSEALFLTLILTGRFLPPVNEVAFPAYSELHKQGTALAPFFTRTVRTVLLVCAPAYIGLSLVAEPAVLILFGPKWAEMSPIIAGLALAMPAMAVQIVCSPATNATGRPHAYLATSAAGAVIFPIGFLIGIGSGPMGLVHAWWVAAPLLLVITLAVTLPIIKVRMTDLLAQLAPVMLATGAMAAAVYLVRMAFADMGMVVELLSAVVAGAVVYGGVLWLVWPHILRETWAMLRHGEAGPTQSPPMPRSGPQPSADVPAA